MKKTIEQWVKEICEREHIPVETIQPLSGGQVNQVFRVNDRFVVRIGARENAFERLRCETELLQRLTGQIPVPGIIAFGQHDEQVYQIQEYVRGQKLYLIWDQLMPNEQEQIVAEFARYRQTLAALRFNDFGSLYEPAGRCASWDAYFSTKLQNILAEIQALQIHMAPGFLELARAYFDEHRSVLQAGAASLVHGDLWLGNILVDQGHISALLDFEFALQAPPDYELFILEAFCVYPNDYAEEDPAVTRSFSSADFGGFFKLLQRYDARLFETPDLRERLNLYHLVGTLSSYLEWRKQQHDKIPFDRPAAQGFYMARIANFSSNHNARMF